MTSRATRGLLPDRRTAALLGLLVVVAFVVRIDLLRNTATPIPPGALSDAGAYRLLGANLADGKGYVRPFDLQLEGRSIATAEYPPGYPVFLAAADKAGVTSEDGQRSLLCLLGSLTVGLVGLIARRLGGDAVGLLAAAVAALHPSLWSTDTSPLAEPLAAFLGMAAVLAALAVHDDPRRSRWIVLGVVAGLGGLVRSELLLMGPLLLVPSGWRLAADRRLRVASVAIGLAAMAAVLAPWTVRNAVTFHELVPVSNNLGSVARGANCDGAYHGDYLGLWVTNVSTDGGDQVDPSGRCFTGFDLEHGQNEAQSAAQLRGAGVSYARHHLGEVPRVVAARVGRTVGLYRFDQQTNFATLEGRTARWDRWGTRLFQALAVVALLGAVVPWRRRAEGPRWMVVVPLVAVSATVVVTYGNLRFRAVADPAVVILAALALGDLAARVARPR
ncbi:hypothetical protein BH10ACT1_BH10ACT1_13930 [soil metagenome]